MNNGQFISIIGMIGILIGVSVVGIIRLTEISQVLYEIALRMP